MKDLMMGIADKFTATGTDEDFAEGDDDDDAEFNKPDFMPVTIDELNRWADWRERKKGKADQKYVKSYTDALTNLALTEKDPEVQKAVMDTVKTRKFNVRHSDNGVSDARTNWLEAKIDVL